MWGSLTVEVVVILSSRRWLGLGSGLRHIRTYYFRLGTKWKSCPLVRVCLLSNNYWPIFGKKLIGVFNRISFSRTGLGGTKIFLIIPKSILSILILSGGGLNTSYNGKGGLVSWSSWILVSKDYWSLSFSVQSIWVFGFWSSFSFKSSWVMALLEVVIIKAMLTTTFSFYNSIVEPFPLNISIVVCLCG